MAGISTKVQRRIESDFPHHPNLVAAALAGLADQALSGRALNPAAIERLQVAALLATRGDLRKLDDAILLGKTDWRDLLVYTGLADEGWQDRVAAELVYDEWNRRA